MDKECTYLSDEETLVTNENGKVTKTNIVLENALEQINNTIEKLEGYEEFCSDRKMTFRNYTKMSIFFLLLLSFSLITTEVIGYLSGTTTFLREYPSLFILIPTIGSQLFPIACLISDKRSIKYNIENREKLFEAYEIKRDLEQKISDIKKQSENIENKRTVQVKNTYSYQPNSVISIEKNNLILDDVFNKGHVKKKEKQYKKCNKF